MSGPAATISRARTALVTGCAGFLGSHLCEALLEQGFSVRGVDSFSPYYPRAAKERNVAALAQTLGFSLIEGDLTQLPLGVVLDGVDVVFHLAAQPGVRASFGRGLDSYLRDNVTATQRLLEAARDHDLAAFVYASSSSVYGDQETYPAGEDARLCPVSPYGVTKVITEELARAFWHSAGVPVVGLRYFTVYGPRQRPDMAFSQFIERALGGLPLTILGDGRQVREFTYMGDVVDATLAAAARGERGSVYNIGGGEPVILADAIGVLEELVDRRLTIEHRQAAAGDPRRTHADISRAVRDLGYTPSTTVRQGLALQLEWAQSSLVPDAGAPSARPRIGGVEAVGGMSFSSSGRPRVLAYSHDGYGLGHLRRNLRIITGMSRQRPDIDALLITGAKWAARLVAGSGAKSVELPPVVKVAKGTYAADSGHASLKDVITMRSELIAKTLREFDPDLVLVDRYPRGMHNELAQALAEHAVRRPDAPVVLGLRDILDAPAVIREEWQGERYSETIARYYESVLCYGDPAVYDPVSEYRLAPEVARRIRFTGYLVDEPLAGDATAVRRRYAGPGQRLAVCTLGGGRDAAHIADTFLSSMERLSGREWAGVLIAGPYMSPADLEHLRGHRAAGWVSVLQMVDNVPSYLAAADAAVCMGGYNTTCELLALAVPAVIIPRTKPRLEQLMRAQRLAARGLLRWLHPSALTPTALADALEAAVRRSRAELAEMIGGINHRGIQTAALHLTERLPASQPAAAPARMPLALARMVAGAI